MRLGNLRKPLYGRQNSGFGKFVIKATFAKNLGGRVSVVQVRYPIPGNQKTEKCSGP
jgi:hypothetical protein